jgi:hypothetical protein
VLEMGFVRRVRLVGDDGGRVTHAASLSGFATSRLEGRT